MWGRSVLGVGGFRYGMFKEPSLAGRKASTIEETFRRPRLGPRSEWKMSRFDVGDRVLIRGHWEFPDGTTGTVSAPEPFLLELSGPGEWVGHVRTFRGAKGPVTTYYVRFDHPTDDGSGDGPYSGGEIEAECLVPLRNG
jgi:hypothetical protein